MAEMMSTRIRMIVGLIKAEADGRTGADYVSQLYSVFIEVGLAVGEVMEKIREEERRVLQ